MLRRLATVALCTVLGAGVASSTTVIPPTFDQLVSGAQLIFTGEVMNKQSFWENRSDGNRAIVTRVTFRVEDVWKGSAGTVTQLQFLGGEVGEAGLRVAEMPEFEMGQRDVLFVGETARVVSPLVGFMHGRLRILRDPDTGADRVYTFDGQSLGATADLGTARTPSLRSVTAMRLLDLKAAVAGRIAAGRGR